MKAVSLRLGLKGKREGVVLLVSKSEATVVEQRSWEGARKTHPETSPSSSQASLQCLLLLNPTVSQPANKLGQQGPQSQPPGPRAGQGRGKQILKGKQSKW